MVLLFLVEVVRWSVGAGGVMLVGWTVGGKESSEVIVVENIEGR